MVFNSLIPSYIVNFHHVIDICDVPNIDFCSHIDLSYIPSASLESDFFATNLSAAFLHLNQLFDRKVQYL